MSAETRGRKHHDHRIGALRMSGGVLLIGPPWTDGLGELSRRTRPRAAPASLRGRLLDTKVNPQLRRWWLGLHPGTQRSILSDQGLVAAVLRDLSQGRLAAVFLPTVGPAYGDGALAPVSPRGAANLQPEPGPRDNITGLDLTHRFGIVIARAAKKLPGDVASALHKLAEPRSLAMFAGALAILAAGQVMGWGEAVDAALLAAAYALGGMAALKGVVQLIACAVSTVSARVGADLDVAAAELAEAVEELGVAALTLLLVRASATSAGGAEADASAAESRALSAGERPRPQNPGPRAAERPTAAGKAVSEDEAASAVSRSEAELAKSASTTPAAIAARERVVTDFYERNGMGLKLKDELSGIDLTKPVEVVTFPPPPTMNQYVLPKRGVGRFFDPVGGQTPNQLGISGEGRVLQTFETPVGEGLRNTSGPILDTWTTPGEAVACDGGGSQIVVNPATSQLFKLSK